MGPLDFILMDLEESIKRTVTTHATVQDAIWRNLNQRLNHTTTLSVYCDCSVIAGRLHLGVCIAGMHTCRLFGSSVDTKFPQHTVVGEIQALEFAIHCVERVISTSECNAVKSIALFSDVQHIQRLLDSKPQQLSHPVSEAVRRLRQHMNQFSDGYSDIRLRVNYLGNAAQRDNVYYQAAHKVARTVARVNSKPRNK